MVGFRKIEWIGWVRFWRLSGPPMAIAMVLTMATGCLNAEPNVTRTGPQGAQSSQRQGDGGGGADAEEDAEEEDESKGAGGGSAATEDEPCQDGATRECKVDLGTHNGVTSCFVGIETCLDGEWGTCSDPPVAEDAEAG